MLLGQLSNFKILYVGILSATRVKIKLFLGSEVEA